MLPFICPNCSHYQDRNEGCRKCGTPLISTDSIIKEHYAKKGQVCYPCPKCGNELVVKSEIQYDSVPCPYCEIVTVPAGRRTDAGD